jgi:peptidoglycan/xylan/chitin deacetylase (PgdA/CDA1 family)
LLLLTLDCTVVCANQATAFVYHRFNESRYPTTSITSADFRSHLELLKQLNFEVLTLGQVVARLQTNTALPDRCAVITIDDAYRSFLTEAWPLLQEYGYPVTLFVSTDTVGGEDFLTWQEIAMLQSAGVEVGNHSAGHPYMLDRFKGESQSDWERRINGDLSRSRQAFLKHLGSAPVMFAYPYGEFSPELTSLIEKVGFVAAFGQQSGVIASGQDLFQLPRFPVAGRYALLDEFRNKLFLQNLPVEVPKLQSPVINSENPPTLRFYLKPGKYVADTLRCFVPGQNECMVRAIEGETDWYEVGALNPLGGRRSKYTLTASDASGRVWYWFSQLWVLPRVGAVSDNSVPR